MNRARLREKLHLSGIDSAAASLARRYGLGFEITAFCMASALEDSAAFTGAEQAAAGVDSLWLHAPLPSCTPAPSTRWCGRSRRGATARQSPWPAA